MKNKLLMNRKKSLCILGDIELRKVNNKIKIITIELINKHHNQIP